MAEVQGDILALYKYYRLSDYESTCLTLKNKILIESAIWFEGYMDFSFKCCRFEKPIYWGVEGARLEGDTRGTDENDDTFPIYGSNGLNFDTCTFTPDAPVTIEANCVALFINCVFEGDQVFTIGNNTRVEFIDCTFNLWRFDITDYCDVRFRRCTWTSPRYHATIANGCQCTYHDCEYNIAQTYVMNISQDSKVIMTGHTPVDITSGITMFIVSDKSSLDMYNFGTLSTPESCLDIDDSKYKGRKIKLMSAVKDTVVANNKAEVFLKEVDEIISVLTALKFTDSLLRMEVNQLTQGIIHGIEAFDQSEIIVKDFDKIIGINLDAIWGSESNFRVFDGNIIMNESEAAGIYLTGVSKSIFKNISGKIQGMFYGININDQAEISIDTCPLIYGVIYYGIFYNNPKIECINVDTIKGLIHGIHGVDGTLRIRNTSIEIYGETEHGMDITTTLYEFKDIDFIHGLLKGAILTNCKGVLKDVREIQGETEEGLVLLGMSGPTEWITVQKIWSPVMQGLIFTGDAAQSRFSGIEEIYSLTLEGVIWTQSGGVAVFSHFGHIYSIPESGLEVHISEGAILEMDIGDKITSEEKHAIEGDNAGILVFTNIDEISSQNGDIVKLTGSGEDSSTKFKTIQLMKTDQAPDDAIKIAGNGVVVLQDIPEITVKEAAEYVVKLSSLNPGYGNIKVLDCKSITAEKAKGGLKVSDALITDVVGIDEPCEIKLEEAEIAVFDASSTKLYFRNYSEISATDGEADGVKLDDLSFSGSEMELYNIELIKAKGHGINITSSGKISLVEIKEVDVSEGEKDALHYEGEGHLYLQGQTVPVKLSAKDVSKNAIYVLGTSIAQAEFVNVETQADKGKSIFEKSDLLLVRNKLKGDVSFTDCVARSVQNVFSRSIEHVTAKVDYYNSDITLAVDPGEETDFVVDPESAVYLFRSDITGTGKVSSDGVIHGDINEFAVPTVEGTTGVWLLNVCSLDSTVDISNSAAIFNLCTSAQATSLSASAVIGNLCTFEDALDILSGGCSVMNLVEVTGKLTAAGGNILNGCNTGSLDGSLAVIANGLFCHQTTDLAGSTAAILNKFETDGPLDVSSKSALIINQGKMDNTTTLAENVAFIGNQIDNGLTSFAVGSSSGVFLNEGTLGPATIAAESGVVLNSVVLANNLTVAEDTGIIFNHVGGAADDPDYTFGENSGILANWLQGNSVTLSGGGFLGHTGLVSAYMQLEEDFTLATDTAAIMASQVVRGICTLPEKANIIGCGVFYTDTGYESPTGAGHAILLHDYQMGDSSNHVLGFKTGIVIRGTNDTSQVLIKTPHTSAQWGDGTSRENVRVRADEGVIQLNTVLNDYTF
jgi:hypothetical protein